jgi:nitrate/nitrite transport system ATP-binding protein
MAMTGPTPILELRSVSKSYVSGDTRTDVLKNVSLSVAQGEFVAVVGFSSSGKTTLISLISGLEPPDSGEVLFRGKKVTEPGPERGVVFQNYSLMPWLSVADNVALAVDSVFEKETSAIRRERTRKYVNMVGLGHAAERKPAELSGGMRQRVAVARALAMDPEVLLLDEPLSALDALTRANLQDEIEAIWSQEKKTVLLITNDVDEALLLADRIVPLNPGPGATFGPEFVVPFARPRDRAALNDSAAYKRLRAAVTQYLMDAGVKRDAGATEDASQLPNVVPVAFDPGPPRAYREAAAGPADQRYVEFYETTKAYPTPKGPVTIVDKFNLLMRKGEFISLIGHSGCGKSTVLSMVAGLNEVSGGGIVLDGREVTTAGPDRAVVFQAPSLFPWMTVRENVLIGVERVFPHASKAERGEIVDYYLAKVGLADAMDKGASELSKC